MQSIWLKIAHELGAIWLLHSVNSRERIPSGLSAFGVSSLFRQFVTSLTDTSACERSVTALSTPVTLLSTQQVAGRTTEVLVENFHFVYIFLSNLTLVCDDGLRTGPPFQKRLGIAPKVLGIIPDRRLDLSQVLAVLHTNQDLNFLAHRTQFLPSHIASVLTKFP